jgi:hypothetical protein
MADKSIANLKEVSTPTSNDLALLVTDVATLPTNKKSTLATFFNKIPTWLGLSTTPVVYTVGEIDVTTPVSFLSITGDTTFSLPAGSIGQIKILVVTVAASTPSATFTPIASANDGYNTLTFNTVGQSATLIYENSGWILLSQSADGFLLNQHRTIQGLTASKDILIKNPASTEVARIHGGAIGTASVAGTSTSLAGGTGFGYRRRVFTLGSGNADNILTLTAADSSAIIYVTPNNAVSIILPLVGTETGIWFDIIIAENHNAAISIKTSGQDGADNITLFSNATDAVAADVGGSDHDILTFTNSLIGSRIELINCAGGDAEEWHAYVTSMNTVDASIA